MEEWTLLAPAALTETARALARCNAWTARFGLTLTEEETAGLAQGRAQALRDTGRVEFGEGILPRLALAFCDSPWLHQDTWAETLLALQAIFYADKNAFGDRISDDGLLKLLRRAFDGRARGAVELLADCTPAELLGREEVAADDGE